MLVAVAAARWNVSPSECRTRNGRVRHPPTRQSLSYGDLAEAAGELDVPQEPRLKRRSEFRLINQSLPQVDTLEKVTGRADFGIDVRVPNMLFATVVHSPVFGGSVQRFDDVAARAVPGVREVVQISTGIAVVAENTWAAFQGAKALDISWDNGSFAMSSADIGETMVAMLQEAGAEARNEGDADGALRGASHRIDTRYEAPYLAHATMEPMNCTADVRVDRCEVWAPTQNPQGTQGTAARLTGLPSERVTVHVTHLGCGWGRRSRTDFVQDAVETSKAIRAPVQVVWTREEDMQHDFYRPISVTRFEGGLDSSGRPVAFKARIVASPIVGRGAGRGVDRNGVDGIANMMYSFPNVFIDNVQFMAAVPTGHWRAVGPTQNTFFLESFVDEMAHAAGRDPVDFRRDLLRAHPRGLRVLNAAAERSDWTSPMPAGRARGVAIVENKGSVVAQVVEVSILNGQPRVHRVTCVADCGQVIHPGIVEAQMVGSVVTGLGTALHGEITIDRGRVTQGNFDDFPVLRIDEAPETFDVHILESSDEPGAVGEPGVPAAAPALTNAIFALTGHRFRRLPIVMADLPTDAQGRQM